MCELVGIAADPAAKLDDGSAYEVYRRMIAAQGGDPDAVLATAPLCEEVLATKDGVVHGVDALRGLRRGDSGPDEPARRTSSVRVRE
jgi:thymidine phosphorylase